MKLMIPVLLFLGGATLTIASWPAQYINAPQRVSVNISRSKSALVLIIYTNLSGEPAKLNYAGDCCSVPAEWIIPPYTSSNLEVRFYVGNYGTGSMSKMIELTQSKGSRITHLALPIKLDVSQ